MGKFLIGKNIHRTLSDVIFFTIRKIKKINKNKISIQTLIRKYHC